METPKEIVIVRPKQLSAKDKEKLTKKGFIVIENQINDPIAFKPMTYQQDLVSTSCYTCGDPIYMHSERLNRLKKNGVAFYCSLGHSTNFIVEK